MSKRTLRSQSSEQRVCAYLSTKGWTEIHHNLRCFHVQLDIIARSPRGVLTIVEVKMQTKRRVAHVSRRQAERLFRAASVLAECEPVQIAVAFVEPTRIRLLPLE